MSRSDTTPGLAARHPDDPGRREQRRAVVRLDRHVGGDAHQRLGAARDGADEQPGGDERAQPSWPAARQPEAVAGREPSGRPVEPDLDLALDDLHDEVRVARHVRRHDDPRVEPHVEQREPRAGDQRLDGPGHVRSLPRTGATGIAEAPPS